MKMKQREKKRVRQGMEWDGGGARKEKGAVESWRWWSGGRLRMRMLRRALGRGLVSRKPQQTPADWGALMGRGSFPEPAPSFLRSRSSATVTPFSGPGKGGGETRAEGAGSRPGLRPRTGPRGGDQGDRDGG